MNRDEAWRRIRDRKHPWDLVVIGGGATGLGIAVDAASRGYDTLLVEAGDFGGGTSSRSTKLIHGGVRYLRAGNVQLVTEALHERTLLRRNAPHLVHDLPFVVPSYDWWEGPFHGIGLKVYDLLAGRHGFGKSRRLTREATLKRLPGIEADGLRGGVVYHDGQFDDARLSVALARTAWREGALVVNRTRAIGLTRRSDLISGARLRDEDDGTEWEVGARCVVNAAGVFSDSVRRLDEPGVTPMIRPSQGVHLVLDRSFLGGDAAIMVPQTDDGRVVFLIPWLDHLLLGTTDTPVEAPVAEPVARREEVDYLLEHAARYLERDPGPEDVKSVFAGLRPLVAGEGSTSALSRDHAVHVSPSGLVTIVGGKWTTYRKMAEDAVDEAVVVGDLPSRSCRTRSMRIHGAPPGTPDEAEAWGPYGEDRDAVDALCAEREEWGAAVHPELSLRGGEVVWAVRHEMAVRVEDVLSRRSRSLILNARAAGESAETVARLMAAEAGRDEAWVAAETEAFRALARGYVPPEAAPTV